MTLFSEVVEVQLWKQAHICFGGVLVFDPDLINFRPASSQSCVIPSWVLAEKSVICSWKWAILDVILKVAGFENYYVKS
jgi:hypothetical protein